MGASFSDSCSHWTLSHISYLLPRDQKLSDNLAPTHKGESPLCYWPEGYFCYFYYSCHNFLPELYCFIISIYYYNWSRSVCFRWFLTLATWFCRNFVVHLFSHVWLFANPWTVAYQAPLSMRLPRILGRILEWPAISFSRGSSQPRDWTHIFCIGR